MGKSINTEYGDLGVFGGKAPDPHAIGRPGAGKMLRENHPNIDYFESCTIIGSDEKAVIAPSRSSHVEQPELVQVESIPPGEKRSLNTATGHVFVAKRGGPDGEHLGQVRVSELDQTVDLG